MLVRVYIHVPTRLLIYQWPHMDVQKRCRFCRVGISSGPELLGMAHSRSHVALCCGVFKRGLPNALVLADTGGPIASQH